MLRDLALEQVDAAGNNDVSQLSKFFLKGKRYQIDNLWLQSMKSIDSYVKSERPFSPVFPLPWRMVIRVAGICLQ